MKRRRLAFILGAGFSASMGLPTLRELFAGLMSQPPGQGESDHEEVFGALEHLYPHFRHDHTPPAYPPFEEFLSFVYAAEDLPGYPEGHWRRKRQAALRLLTDYLWDRSVAAERDSLLWKFTNRLEPGDVVVTFNWDTLLERALVRSGRLINLQHRNPDTVTVLKLHGGLSWVELQAGQEPARGNPVQRLGDGVVTTPDFSYANPWDSLGGPPLIVPSITSKNPPGHAFLKGLWEQAFGALVEA